MEKEIRNILIDLQLDIENLYIDYNAKKIESLKKLNKKLNEVQEKASKSIYKQLKKALNIQPENFEMFRESAIEYYEVHIHKHSVKRTVKRITDQNIIDYYLTKGTRRCFSDKKSAYNYVYEDIKNIK